MRHLNEAWFDENFKLFIYKGKNFEAISHQLCMYNSEELNCGLWCPKCRYIANNKISVCGEIYFTEEYFKRDKILEE